MTVHYFDPTANYRIAMEKSYNRMKDLIDQERNRILARSLGLDVLVLKELEAISRDESRK